MVSEDLCMACARPSKLNNSLTTKIDPYIFLKGVPFDARDGGLGHVGTGVARPCGAALSTRASSELQASLAMFYWKFRAWGRHLSRTGESFDERAGALLLHVVYFSTTPGMPEGRATSNGSTFPPPAICGCDGSKPSRNSRFNTSERATR